jgi:hypothetical protein
MSKISKFEKKYVNTAQDNKIQRIRLSVDNLVASNGIGIINAVINMDPSSSVEWAATSALYDEFRVMGIKVHLFSRQQGSVTAATDVAVIAYDNNTSAALTSLAAGSQYATSHLFSSIWYQNSSERVNAGNGLVFEFMRPTSGKDTAITWVSTALPANSEGSVKFYAANQSNSTTYWSYVAYWFVELRGRN